MSNESIALPSFNPADTDEAGLLEFSQNSLMMKLEKVIPAKILNYNRAKNRAEVQILNNSIYSTGEKLLHMPIPDIPVLMISGGGFTMSYPIKEGDVGWLIAADRDISLFKQFLNIFTPASFEMHRYKDSFFIPDKVNGFNLSSDDADAFVITSLDGTTKLSIKQGQINIKAANIVFEGDTSINGTLTASTVIAQNGSSGTYTNSVTAQNGIVTGGS